MPCSKTDVEWLDVAKGGNEGGLEEDSEVSESVVHSLLGEGQGSAFADHEIGPLYADDSNEISTLGEFKGFSGVADLFVGFP